MPNDHRARHHDRRLTMDRGGGFHRGQIKPTAHGHQLRPACCESATGTVVRLNVELDSTCRSSAAFLALATRDSGSAMLPNSIRTGLGQPLTRP